MGKTILGVVAALALGCGGGDDPPPSCQQAVGNYYAVGCAFFDASMSPPRATTQSEALGACQVINTDVPERCRYLFDDWKFCIGNAQNNSQCDCTQESDALFACD